MGMFSWFSSTTRKSKAAVIVQQAFEYQKRQGLLDSDPGKQANRVVEYACTRVPGLESKYEDHVLAVACLTIATTDTSVSKALQLLYTETLRRFHIVLNQAIEAGHIRLNESQNEVFDTSRSVLMSLDRQTQNIRHSDLASDPDEVLVDIERFARVTGRQAILIEAATSLDSAAMEFEYMSSVLGENGGWSILSQAMVQADGFTYDKAEVLLKDGSTKIFWFDITDSWQRWNQQA